MSTTFRLSLIERGDRVRLRYQGYNVAKRYGETWGTVVHGCFRHNGARTTMVTVALDAIEGDERRVRLGEIGAIERGGVLIAERRQAPTSAADQFPLVFVVQR